MDLEQEAVVLVDRMEAADEAIRYAFTLQS